MTYGSELSNVWLIKVVSLFLVSGAGVGFMFESTLVYVVIQPDVNNIMTTSDSVSQLIITKMLFSLMVALCFALIPLSGAIANNFKPDRYYIWLLFFLIVALVTSIGSILHYRGYYSGLSKSLDMIEITPSLNSKGMVISDTVYIALADFPFFQIPAVSMGVCLILAVFFNLLGKTKANT